MAPMSWSRSGEWAHVSHCARPVRDCRRRPTSSGTAVVGQEASQQLRVVHSLQPTKRRSPSIGRAPGRQVVGQVQLLVRPPPRKEACQPVAVLVAPPSVGYPRESPPHGGQCGLDGSVGPSEGRHHSRRRPVLRLNEMRKGALVQSLIAVLPVDAAVPATAERQCRVHGERQCVVHAPFPRAGAARGRSRGRG